MPDEYDVDRRSAAQRRPTLNHLLEVQLEAVHCLGDEHRKPLLGRYFDVLRFDFATKPGESTHQEQVALDLLDCDEGDLVLAHYEGGWEGRIVGSGGERGRRWSGFWSCFVDGWCFRDGV